MLLIVLYLITMVVYFQLRRRYAHHRFTAEALILSFVVIISSLSRFCFLNVPEMPLVDGGWENYLFWESRLWMTLYTAFGSFQFGGLPEISKLPGIYSFFFFINTALYTGAVVISVVTAKVSYEIYSFFTILFTSKRNTEVYIFADLNNDSLTLAKSIALKHDSYQQKISNPFNKKRCVIIFSGDNLKPFDRRDPLCIEVMRNGFAYYSHHRANGTALLKLLRLLNPKRKISIYERKKVHLFALAQTGPNNVADEVTNIKTIFNELENIFHYYKARGDKALINRVFRFYVLTRDDLPYEKFEAERSAVMKKVYPEGLTGRARTFALGELSAQAIEKHKKKNTLEKALFEKFGQLFPLSLVNEANLTARAFSRKRSALLNSKNQLVQDILQADKVYLPLLLGFGKTNEKVLNQLYIDTAATDEKFNEIFFAATIVDVNLNARIGIYSAEHPYYMVFQHSDSNLFDEVLPLREQYYLEPKDPNKASPLIKEYKALVESIIKKDFEISPLPQIKLPLISYLEVSCTSDCFLNLLNRVTGDPKGQFQTYNTIVIALGDDETNINLANVIINDARKELLRGDLVHTSPQLIAVHISNRNNYFKLQTAESSDENENEKLKDLNVIAFGDVSELYSFDNIVDEKFAKLVNSGYETMSGYIFNSTEALEATINEENNALKEPLKQPLNLSFSKSYEYLANYDKEFTADFTKTVDYLFSKFDVSQVNEKAWLGKNNFKKESNAQVLLYELTAKALAKHNIEVTNKIEWVSANEHIRWNRLYIANGWRYNSKKDEPFLRHDCITSLDLVPELKNLYDIVNFALLVNIDQIREHYQLKR